MNIGTANSSKPDFLKISPNNRMPVIVDHAPAGGGKPSACFESGADSVVPGGQNRQFIPKRLRGQVEVLQWLMWQMGGLGPMLGQKPPFRQLRAGEFPPLTAT